MHFRRRVRRFNGGEALEDAIRMLRAFRNGPRVPCFEEHDLPFEMKLGFAADHVAYDFVVPRRKGLEVGGLFVFP